MRTPAKSSIARGRLAIITFAAALVASALMPTGIAAAAPAPAPSPTPSHHVLPMGSFTASSFAAQAAQLPSALTTALSRDLHQTPTQYLADAAAAARSVKVVASLKSVGTHVLGSKISGTHLTVYVRGSADAAAVQAAGATAVIGAPSLPNFSHKNFHSVAAPVATYGGQGYFFQSSDQIGTTDGFRCSIGFSGYSSSASQFVTAGHCATIMATNARLTTQTAPTNYGGSATITSTDLGTVVSGEAQYGNSSNRDYGIVGEGSSVVAQANLYTWNGGTGAPLASAPLPIVGQSAAVVGASLCKSGSTSGWTCGVVEAVDVSTEVCEQDQDSCPDSTVNSIIATTCLLPGDSGGGAVSGSNAVGIDSGSDFPATSCSNPNAGTASGYDSVFFPMVSTAGSDSVAGAVGANWKLLAAPLVTSPAVGAAVVPGAAMTGTLFNPQSTSQVSLFLNGSTTAFAQASASSGSWSIPLSSLGSGKYSYVVTETVGGNQVATVPGNFVVPVPAAVSGGVGDFNGDGKPDVVVRDSSGNLYLYPGNGANALTARTQLDSSANGWGTATAIVPVGDFSGDGKVDIVQRDKSGNLWLFPGNGSSGFGTKVALGANTTWAGMTSIQGVGDLTGDGKPDVVARDSAGNLWLYPNNGSGTGFGTATKIGASSVWGTMSGILGVGDWNGDGKADLIARDSSGALWLYPGNGSGALQTPVQLGTGWQGLTIIAVGDFNKDGTEDILVRDGNGALFLYPGSGAGALGTRVQIGTGWQGLTIAGDSAIIAAVPIPKPPIPSYLTGGVGDFNSDGNADIVMRDGNGALWLYPGNGSAAVLPRTSLGTASTWASMTALVPVGDFTGDGKPDLIGRDKAGNLLLFTGNGASGLSAGVQIGANTTWAGMTSIQGVGDLTGDHKPDVVARDSAGNLWLYPNNGSGTGFGTATKIGDASVWGSMTGILGSGDWNLDGNGDVVGRDANGNLLLFAGDGAGHIAATGTLLGTGWQGLTIISVGDFNQDGTEDILIRDVNGTLFLYPGNGNGGFSTRIQLGTGWQGLTLAGSSDSIATVAIPKPPIPAAISGGVGDFNSDGNPDVVMRDGNGALWLYPGNGSNALTPRTSLGTASTWASMTAIVPVGDFSGDGHPDLMARTSNGTLELFTGNGASALGGPTVLSGTTQAEMAGMTSIQGVGDMTGDGKPDVMARDSIGRLWLYPNNGSGTGFAARIAMTSPSTTDWSQFTGFLGAGDWNLDGKADLVARDSSGVLWLYPGNGDGTLGTRVQLGTGWQGITVIAVGDFNEDGTEDILIRDANGTLFLYPGNGSGFSPRIQLGTGWQGLTMAGNMDTIPAVTS